MSHKSRIARIEQGLGSVHKERDRAELFRELDHAWEFVQGKTDEPFLAQFRTTTMIDWKDMVARRAQEKSGLDSQSESQAGK